MDKFVECICFDNYDVLIISGKATRLQLLNAWVLILTEYHELKGNDLINNEVWDIQREMIRINNHLVLLQHCVDFLWDKYSDSIVESVCNMGYYFMPATKNPTEYRPLLNSIANQAKTKYIELQQLTIRLEKLLPATEEKIKPEEFEDRLTAFENLQGVAYSLETVTVAKFIALEKKYRAAADAMEAKKIAHGY